MCYLLEEMRKITKLLSRNSRDLNLGPTEYRQQERYPLKCNAELTDDINVTNFSLAVTHLKKPIVLRHVLLPWKIATTECTTSSPFHHNHCIV
jgi:hypothetical protein